MQCIVSFEFRLNYSDGLFLKVGTLAEYLIFTAFCKIERLHSVEYAYVFQRDCALIYLQEQK